MSRYCRPLCCVATSAMLIWSTHALSQTELLFRPPSAVAVAQAITSLAPAQRSYLEAVREEVAPFIIFIPGVLGSQITKTLKSGEKKIVWGRIDRLRFRPDANIAYDEGDKVDVDILKDYFALGYGKDIYGAAINRLRQLISYKAVEPFAYDWRQSNARSSADLAKWICYHRTKIAHSPVVFIAHSMGGLVLKHWLSKRFDDEGCDDGKKFREWINVGKIIFLGTPHYGAPKAVKAFADKVNLLLDPDTTPSWLLGIEARTFTASLNAFGATFPSSYELLPIVNTTKRCLRSNEWPKPIQIRIGAIERTDIELFDIDMWKNFGWPKNLHSSLDRGQFVREKLPHLLESARDFLCDIAQFDIDRKFPNKVSRFFGEKQRTVCQVIVYPSDRDGVPPRVENRYCTRAGGPSDDSQPGDEGDGTVPRWIASDGMREPVGYSLVDYRHSVIEQHVALASSQRFLEYLDSYDEELHFAFRRRASITPWGIEAVAKLYANLQYFVPPRPMEVTTDLAAFVRPSSGLDLDLLPNETTRINQRVAEILGLDPRELYSMAKQQNDPKAFRVFTELADPADPTRAWAFNNAALIYLRNKNFRLAQPNAIQAVRAANQVPSAATSKVRAHASLTASIAALERGEVGNAKLMRNLAVAYGNPKASVFKVGD